MVFPFPFQLSLAVGAGRFLALRLKPVPRQRRWHQFSFPLPMSAAQHSASIVSFQQLLCFKVHSSCPSLSLMAGFQGCKHPSRRAVCSSCARNSQGFYFSAKHRSRRPVESTTNLQTGALGAVRSPPFPFEQKGIED